MEFVTRQVGNRGQFFDLMMRIGCYAAKKIGKMHRLPIVKVELPTSRQPPSDA
jgi:hypothetical protein